MDSYANDLVKVMQTSLTKHEFASALDMKPSDTFVTKMFRVVDQDGDGRISFQVIFIIVYLHILTFAWYDCNNVHYFYFFQEFLDTVIQFSTSSQNSDDKLRIIFDMCIDESQPQDPRKQLTVNKMQVIEMLHSVIDVAKVNEVNTKDVNIMIESMFKEAGLKNKKV